MKVYIKFISIIFFKSLFYVFFVMTSLVFILNILKEVEFFSNTEANSLYPIYLSIMNSPSVLFEMFPFIFFISTQFFFIKLFNSFKFCNVTEYFCIQNNSYRFFVISSVIFLASANNINVFSL